MLSGLSKLNQKEIMIDEETAAIALYMDPDESLFYTTLNDDSPSSECMTSSCERSPTSSPTPSPPSTPSPVPVMTSRRREERQSFGLSHLKPSLASTPREELKTRTTIVTSSSSRQVSSSQRSTKSIIEHEIQQQQKPHIKSTTKRQPPPPKLVSFRHKTSHHHTRDRTKSPTSMLSMPKALKDFNDWAIRQPLIPSSNSFLPPPPPRIMARHTSNVVANNFLDIQNMIRNRGNSCEPGARSGMQTPPPQYQVQNLPSIIRQSLPPSPPNFQINRLPARVAPIQNYQQSPSNLIYQTLYPRRLAALPSPTTMLPPMVQSSAIYTSHQQLQAPQQQSQTQQQPQSSQTAYNSAPQQQLDQQPAIVAPIIVQQPQPQIVPSQQPPQSNTPVYSTYQEINPQTSFQNFQAFYLNQLMQQQQQQQQQQQSIQPLQHQLSMPQLNIHQMASLQRQQQLPSNENQAHTKYCYMNPNYRQLTPLEILKILLDDKNSGPSVNKLNKMLNTTTNKKNKKDSMGPSKWQQLFHLKPHHQSDKDKTSIYDVQQEMNKYIHGGYNVNVN